LIKLIFKYIASFFIFILFGVLLFDYILLPNLVGYDNENFVPDVRGEYLEKAVFTVRSLGFKTKIHYLEYNDKYAPGKIVKIFPRAFTKVKLGRTITLTVSGSPEEVFMPTLTNISLRNASINLQRLGLSIDTLIYEYSNSVKDGYITFQIPYKNKIVQSGSKITLGVSKGSIPDYYQVPDVVDYSLEKGKKIILESGLRIGKIEYEYQPELLNNTIIDQSILAGIRVSFPASIDLIVSRERNIKK